MHGSWLDTRSIDLLTVSACALDADGRITEVNETWRRFAVDNGYVDETFGVGRFYHDECIKASNDPFAVLALQRLEEVLRGTAHMTSFVYPCHLAHAKCWFRCRISRVGRRDRIITAHFDVTMTIRAHQAIGRLPDAAWAGHRLDLGE